MSDYPYQISSELAESTDGVIQVFVNQSSGDNYNRSTVRVRTGIETIGRFLEKVQQALYASQSSFYTNIASGMGTSSCNVSSPWFDQGADCEILKLGSSEWQKGRLKIRVSIEFCPDEPEESKELSEEGELSFPLDELRREEMHY